MKFCSFSGISRLRKNAEWSPTGPKKYSVKNNLEEILKSTLILLSLLTIALEQDGFGTRPFFEAFVAVEKESNQIIGFALYFFTYSTWVSIIINHNLSKCISSCYCLARKVVVHGGYLRTAPASTKRGWFVPPSLRFPGIHD